jgi:hypothetical protein
MREKVARPIETAFRLEPVKIDNPTGALHGRKERKNATGFVGQLTKSKLPNTTSVRSGAMNYREPNLIFYQPHGEVCVRHTAHVSV